MFPQGVLLPPPLRETHILANSADLTDSCDEKEVIGPSD